MVDVQRIEEYSSKLKDLYIEGSEEEKVEMFISLEKLFSCENSYVKNRDKITKLPNRESLMNDIALVKSDAMLIILHINQISAIKELYGFEIVKKIITNKAKKLKALVRDEKTKVFNINLQKFAILVSDKKLFSKYLSIIKYSVLNNIDFDVYNCDNGESIMSDFTAGISYGTEHLHHRANVALQEAVIAKDTCRVYDENPQSIELKRTTLNRLKIYKCALHDGDIIPYFQPIVDAKTSKLMKYEALARLKTPDGEILSPFHFLNSAIEDKTFEFFTRQMMQKVFHVFESSKMPISLNLTYENIISPTMVEYIKNRLDKYGGDGITFEIVETEEIRNYQILEEFILMVKTYGCKVSIDDFGSGYSNFTNIIKLNIDYIKIDGTLITNILKDEKVFNMVHGLIEFSKSINVKTIAEFVTSKELADLLNELNVDYLQGYYFGEPKSAQSYGLV